MTRHGPETPQTSQAAERIRTADPFITREIEVPPSAPYPHEKGGLGRREVTRTAGKDTPLDSKPTLRLVPVTFAEACAFVDDHHRHHRRPRGHKFSVGVAEGDLLVGVAMVGRPVARAYDDGLTLEVNRTATDGTRNANSMLYAAAWRAASALGYRRLITYTQAGEAGSSLRAVGWRVVAERPARPGWSVPSRRRRDRGTDQIPRTLWEAAA